MLLALLAIQLLGCPRTEPRPDVFLVVIDTQRADHLSLYGYEHETSPRLTAFARDAVVYRNAITPGTWTVPAHAALFTGMLPSWHGAERVPGQKLLARAIRPDAVTLAELLRNAGYDTAAVVGNNGYVAEPFGFARGFDSFRARGVGDAMDVRELAAEVLASARTPLFLFLNILDPHEPFTPPPPFDTRFGEKRPEYGTELTAIMTDEQPASPEALRHFRSQYDGEVAYTDQALDELLSDLKKAGRYDSSLIIVTSDHGELLGEHGESGHGGYPFEQLIHVPLIVKYPGNREAGSVVTRRVSTLGIFATILATAGVSLPQGVQARPLAEPHDVWVEDVDFHGRRVTVTYDGEHKLIRLVSPDGEHVHVYDLADEPSERRTTKERSAADDPLQARVRAFSALPRPKNLGALPVIDGERERRLRALGYVE